MKLYEYTLLQLKAEQNNPDTEVAHGNADDLLCDLLKQFGLNRLVEEYNKIDKWYA